MSTISRATGDLSGHVAVEILVLGGVGHRSSARRLGAALSATQPACRPPLTYRRANQRLTPLDVPPPASGKGGAHGSTGWRRLAAAKLGGDDAARVDRARRAARSSVGGRRRDRRVRPRPQPRSRCACAHLVGAAARVDALDGQDAVDPLEDAERRHQPIDIAGRRHERQRSARACGCRGGCARGSFGGPSASRRRCRPHRAAAPSGGAKSPMALMLIRPDAVDLDAAEERGVEPAARREVEDVGEGDQGAAAVHQARIDRRDRQTPGGAD